MGGVLLLVGDDRLPKMMMSGEMENAGQCRPGKKVKNWRGYVSRVLPVFGITGTEVPSHEILGHDTRPYAKVVGCLGPLG